MVLKTQDVLAVNILQLCSPELLVLMQWSREVLDSLIQMHMECITCGVTDEIFLVGIENWECVQYSTEYEWSGSIILVWGVIVLYSVHTHKMSRIISVAF